jgi:hypothetical protein
MLTTVWSQINYLAVLVAGLAHMAANLIWFSPLLFGPAWAKLTGSDSKPAVRWMPAGFLGHLLVALVLAVIIVLAQATTVAGGIAVGVLAWAGFIVPLEVGELIWEKIPFKLFGLRVICHLVACCIAGVILAMWR